MWWILVEYTCIFFSHFLNLVWFQILHIFEKLNIPENDGRDLEFSSHDSYTSVLLSFSVKFIALPLIRRKRQISFNFCCFRFDCIYCINGYIIGKIWSEFINSTPERAHVFLRLLLFCWSDLTFVPVFWKYLRHKICSSVAPTVSFSTLSSLRAFPDLRLGWSAQYTWSPRRLAIISGLPTLRSRLLRLQLAKTPSPPWSLSYLLDVSAVISQNRFSKHVCSHPQHIHRSS